VVDLVDEPAVADTKDLAALVDDEPVLTTYQLQLAHRMAQDNLATLSQCLDLIVPPGLSQQADILVQREISEAPTDLTPLQKRLLDLLERRGALRGRQVDAALPRANWRDSLPALVKLGVVSSRSVLPPPAVRPRVVRTAQFSAPPGWREDSSLNIGRVGSAALERRQAALTYLEAQAIPVNVSWVYAASGASSKDLTRLVC